MIRRIQVSNFRSLGENVTLELGPLTVLVGQNASGKSNVADVLQFVADTLRLGLERAVMERHGFGTICRSGTDKLSIRVDVESDKGRGFWELVLGKDESGEGYRITRERGEWEKVVSKFLKKRVKKKGTIAAQTVEQENRERLVNEAFHSFDIEDGNWRELRSIRNKKKKTLTLRTLNTFLSTEDWRFEELAAELQDIAIYRISPDRLREAQRSDMPELMRTRGENWASVLRHMDKANAGSDFLAALGHIVGDIDDYRVNAVDGYLIPELRRVDAKGSQVWRGAVQESDGTLRIAGILTALLQAPPLGLIGVEEPEQTIHLAAIDVLVDYIREALIRSQVLLTTYSSALLDRLDIDDIRVVERRDRGTTVSLVDETQRSLVKKRLATVGELVFSEGLRGRENAHY